MKTQIARILVRTASSVLLLTAWCFASQAQTTATWIGAGGDSDWNTALNWDFGVPAEGTNAVIGSGANVNYNAPMTAGCFGTLALNGMLNVNAGSFVSGGGAGLVSGTTARLFVNSGGVASVTNGNLAFNTSASGAVAANASLTVQGALQVGGSGSIAYFTNSGGTLTAGSVSINPNNYGSGSASCMLTIAGGTSTLGAVTIRRGIPASQPAVGTDGLIISNGVVNMTSLTVNNGNSFGSMLVAGGAVTNTGNFIVGQQTGANNRQTRFLQTGGLMVSTISDGIRIGVTNGTQTVSFAVTGGTNIAERVFFGDVTNGAPSVTINFTNAARMYLGGGGMASNIVTTLNVALNNGGLFGAKADWASSLSMILNSGTFTFQTADQDGTPRNITLNGVLRGTGTLAKSGAGTLTLGGVNTFSGSALVNQGTLTLATGGSMANCPQIMVASGATFDVSAGGFTLLGSQAVGGNGAVLGTVTALSGARIQPGSNTVAGTLVFSNGLSQTGGVINNFDLSDDPTGVAKANDLLIISGDLTLSGTNTIQINPLNGPLPGSSTYKLIQYGGTLNGGATNFALAGAVGSIIVDTTAKTVSLVVQGATRSPTNVVWLGGLAANTWDIYVSSNWLNGITRDIFVTGDSARFDATGATNPLVNIVGSVTPASVVVDATTNYTFTGSGSIDGSGGLAKTNSGTLTVLTTNTFTGPTLVTGGVLEAIRLANGGNPGSLGTASSDPANLVLQNGTLRYLGGSSSTDRGVTLNDAGGTLDVAANGTTLTMSGPVIGAGGLTKAGAGTLILSAGNSYGVATTLSNGVLQVNSTISAISTGAVNFAGGTLNLNVSGQQTYPNALNVTGSGAIVSGGGNNNILTGPWTGTGAVSVSVASGGFFSLSGNLDAGFTGSINLGNSAGTLRFNSGGSDPCKGSSNVVFDLGTNTAILVNRNGGTYGTTTYFLGGLAGGPGTRLQGSANTGSPNTYEVGGTGANTTFAGTIANGAGGSSALITLSKVGNGTLTLSGTNTYSGATFVTNGTLALSAYGSIGSSTTIKVVTNAFLDISARADGALILNNNQTLLGDGTILGSVTARSGSAISPGEVGGLPARLTITNALVFQSGSTNVMDLDYYQLAGGMTNDQISGLSSVTYGGTLALLITSVETNSIFKLFNAASYQGSFSAVNILVGGLPMGTVWDTSYLTVDGTLRVVPLRPSFNPPVLTGSDITLSGINGTPFATYSVLVSTNAALPLTQWTAVTTNTFNFDGSFNVTIPINPGWPQAFYELLMQ